MTDTNSMMSSKHADSPLVELAKAISVCGRRGITPVIVCGPKISLADDFFVELCRAVTSHSGRNVRLDLLPGHRLDGYRWAGWSRLLSMQRVKRLRKQLRNAGNASSETSTTIALSRQGVGGEPLVIGLAGPQDHLPTYAKLIELAI